MVFVPVNGVIVELQYDQDCYGPACLEDEGSPAAGILESTTRCASGQHELPRRLLILFRRQANTDVKPCL